MKLEKAGKPCRKRKGAIRSQGNDKKKVKWNLAEVSKAWLRNHSTKPGCQTNKNPQRRSGGGKGDNLQAYKRTLGSNGNE